MATIRRHNYAEIYWLSICAPAARPRRKPPPEILRGLFSCLGGVAALGDVIEPRQRGPDIADNRQLGVWIADAQNPAHRPSADNHPVHIASGALHAGVVQGSEALAPEEVDAREIEDELFGDPGVALDEAAQPVTVRGVDVTCDGDQHARCGQDLGPMANCGNRFIGAEKVLHGLDYLWIHSKIFFWGTSARYEQGIIGLKFDVRECRIEFEWVGGRKVSSRATSRVPVAREGGRF